MFFEITLQFTTSVLEPNFLYYPFRIIDRLALLFCNVWLTSRMLCNIVLLPELFAPVNIINLRKGNIVSLLIDLKLSNIRLLTILIYVLTVNAKLINILELAERVLSSH